MSYFIDEAAHDFTAKSGTTSPRRRPSPRYTTKADLRHGHWREQLRVSEDRVVRYHSSSGSTGVPTVMAYTAADLALLGRLTARTFKPLIFLGLPRWLCYNAFGYGLFTGGLSFEAAAAHARCHVPGTPPLTVIPASNSHGPTVESALAQHGRLLALFAPNVLFCTPSLAFALWEKRLLGGVDAIICGGEPSSAALRELLATRPEEGVAAGAGRRRVVEAYGLSEVIGPGVAQSCERGMLHLNEDAFECELADGELVLTTRLNEAMPRSRYRTGDAVVAAQCPCGAPGRPVRVLGRLASADFVEACGMHVAEIEEALVRRGYSPCFTLRGGTLSVEPLKHAAAVGAPSPPASLLELPTALRGFALERVPEGTLPHWVGKSARHAASSS